MLEIKDLYVLHDTRSGSGDGVECFDFKGDDCMVDVENSVLCGEKNVAGKVDECNDGDIGGLDVLYECNSFKSRGDMFSEVLGSVFEDFSRNLDMAGIEAWRLRDFLFLSRLLHELSISSEMDSSTCFGGKRSGITLRAMSPPRECPAMENAKSKETSVF